MRGPYRMRRASSFAVGMAALTLAGCARQGARTIADGLPCEWNAQCVGGLCLPALVNGASTGWTDGTCTAPCVNHACASADEACLDLGIGGACLPKCGGRLACRSGYVCDSFAQACLPDCRAGWSCGSSLTCKEDGTCGIAASTLAAIGQGCTSNTECASGICFAETKNGASTGWTGGTCSAPCAAGACAAGAACSVLDGKTWCLRSCANDSDCRSSYVCDPDYHSCLPDCRNAGWSCGTSLTCGTDGHCVVPQTNLAPVGAPCEVATDCASGQCLSAVKNGAPTGWAAGMCVDGCSGGMCATGSACAQVLGGAWCVEACAGGGTCRPGYLCGNGNACLPDCRNGGALCASGQACGADGRCATTSVTLAAIGQSCAQNSDCQSGQCTTDAGWTGGTCTSSCVVGSATCPTGSTCLGGPVGPGRCVASCNTATSCRTGYVCAPMQSACVPNCHNAGFICPTGSCNPLGLCGP